MSDIVDRARRNAKVIYIAVAESVANEIAGVFVECADELERLRAEMAHERLRYDGMRSDRDDWRQRAEQAQAEVAQARAERDEARLNLEGLRRSLYATEESSANQYQRAERAEATITTLRAELQAAQALVRVMDDLLPRLRPGGHDGDEETGWCDEDCAACAFDAIKAAAEQAHPTTAQEGQ